MTMNNGKYLKYAIAFFALGAYLGNRSFKKNIRQKDSITWMQYMNRLQEFCLYNLDTAKKDYIELINSGISYDKAFYETLISNTAIEELFGDIND